MRPAADGAVPALLQSSFSVPVQDVGAHVALPVVAAASFQLLPLLLFLLGVYSLSLGGSSPGSSLLSVGSSWPSIVSAPWMAAARPPGAEGVGRGVDLLSTSWMSGPFLGQPSKS